MRELLLYLGAALPVLWGVSHLIPTANVIRGFGAISIDNRRIVAMEWINEGATLIFIGLLVGAVTAVDSASDAATTAYLASFVALNALSVISLFTGFRINFLPFRLCPLIFTGSSLFILAGSQI
jgi:hypothetical protein